MSTLALFSIKGGVGKTTAAVNLAYVAASEGARTLVWDLDPQAAATYCLGVDDGDASGGLALVTGATEPESPVRRTAFEHLDLLPADVPLPFGDESVDDELTPARLRRMLGTLSSRYDHVVLDCPAGLSPTTDAIIDSVDALVVPTIPTTLSTRTLDQLRGHLSGRERSPVLLPFLSMVDRRRKLHQDVSREVAQERSYLAVWVPYASQVERVSVRRGPIGSFARVTAAARSFELMWSEISGRLTGEHISTRGDEPSQGPAIIEMLPSGR